MDIDDTPVSTLTNGHMSPTQRSPNGNHDDQNDVVRLG